MTEFDIEMSRSFAGFVEDARQEGYENPRVCGLAALLSVMVEPLGVTAAEFGRAAKIAEKFLESQG